MAAKEDGKPISLATWIPVILAVAGMIWAGASSLQSKFDTLDKRQAIIETQTTRMESKLDTLMSAFNVKYEMKTTAAAK